MEKSIRKRRSFWIDAAFLFTIAVLLVSVLGLMSVASKEATSASSSKGAAAGSKINISTKETEVPGITIVTEKMNSRHFSNTVQYPQTKHETFNEVVATYIDEAKKEIAKIHKKSSDTEVDIKLEMSMNTQNQISFLFIQNEGTGPADKIKTIYLDNTTGDILEIPDLFKDENGILTELSERIRKHIQYPDSISKTHSGEEIQALTEPAWTNYNHFTLSAEYITFYLGGTESVSGTAGFIQAMVPLNEISDILSEKLQWNIDKSKEQESDLPEIEEGQSDYEINSEDKENKKIALTFDDGPHPQVTPQILKTLKKYDAKATFFMLGSMVQSYPELAREVQASGHELGNHTWNHPDLTKIAPEEIRWQITASADLIEQATGQRPSAFRPPYGAFNDTVLQQTDLPVTLWDIDTLDWKDRDAGLLLAAIKRTAKDGGTILMHDIHQSTADGLEAVLTYLQNEGYSFVGVSEL